MVMTSRHGHAVRGHRTPTYHSWSGMLGRCRRDDHPQAKDYSGRGIKVCDRWKSFDKFLEDMGPRPAGLTLERMDNNRNYEPDNCVWATPAAQQRNSRHTRLITHNGKTMCLKDWALSIGAHPSTLHLRLKGGWSIERALHTPVRAGNYK